MLKNFSLGLGTGTIFVAAALVALLMLVGTAFAAGDITVGSDTVDNTGDEASVVVSAAAPSGSGIGNWLFEVSYDPAELGVPTCASLNAAGGCTVNPDGKTGIIVASGFFGDIAGLTGTVDLFSITANAGVAAGECSDLTISSVTAFEDSADGTPFANPTLGAGQICVAAAATAAPTATPGGLPTTGGNPGTSSTSYLAWLLAATGLVVVAGGAWALAHARREN